MKKTIGTVRTMVLGGMLGMALHCEGMDAQHVVSLIHSTHKHTMPPLWTNYLSRDFAPTTQTTDIRYANGPHSLLSFAAMAGQALLMMAMGRLETLTGEDFANLIEAFDPVGYSADDEAAAIRALAGAVVTNVGPDAAQTTRSSAGRTVAEIVGGITNLGTRSQATGALRTGGFPI
ncbi:MAG: hypothetical protein LBS14_00490 [Holosporaceae bacterium]|nr:hypothetical protein [Holosporaceae bacterium]